MSPARQPNNNLINFDKRQPDPAVGKLLTNAEQKQDEARMPKADRQRKVRERNRQKARLSRRLNIDLPENVKARLVAMAASESVPISQLAAFILIPALDELEKTQNPLWGYKLPSNCAKYEFVVNLEKRQKECL